MKRVDGLIAGLQDFCQNYQKWRPELVIWKAVQLLKFAQMGGWIEDVKISEIGRGDVLRLFCEQHEEVCVVSGHDSGYVDGRYGAIGGSYNTVNHGELHNFYLPKHGPYLCSWGDAYYPSRAVFLVQKHRPSMCGGE